jgi:membrane protein
MSAEPASGGVKTPERTTGRLRAVAARARSRVRRVARAVWSRDRTRLSPPAAFANRVGRVVVWTVRGIVRHRISLQAAALTYYTVFAIVPLLVVVLWLVKALDILPWNAAALPLDGGKTLEGNDLLRQAMRVIRVAVERGGQRLSGVVGLAVLLFAVVKMIGHVDRALVVIASARRRSPIPVRALGYLALLALPPMLLGILGALAGAAQGKVWGLISRVLGVLPGVKLAAGVVAALVVLWLALTIFYAAAPRARMGLRSSAVGAVVSAVLLAGVLWAFTEFQIGVSKAGALQSGMAAVPVFMLWVFSSWFVVLVGAEIAIGHSVDRIVCHGTTAWRLDGALAQAAAVAVMVRAAQAGDGKVTVASLCRQLRLLPGSVRWLGARLVGRGLLVDVEPAGYRLACHPWRTRLGAILRAVMCDPELEWARAQVCKRLGRQARSALARRVPLVRFGRADSSAALDGDPTLAALVAEADRIRSRRS